MAHNNLLRNPVANWTNGSTVLPTELGPLEANLVASVNGDDGGVWAPTSQIVISGAGLQVSGLVRVTRSGVLTCSSNTLPVLVLNGGVNDFPAYAPGHAGRTRVIQIPCGNAIGLPEYTWKTRREDAGLQSWAPTFDLSDGQGFRQARALVPLRAHNGSTISKVTVNFRVSTPHTALPAVMPSFRVFRIDAVGNQVPLTSVAAGGDASGYAFVPKASSPSGWYNGGAKQSFTITCDQNNVVDISQYEYLVEIVDEQITGGYPLQITFKQPVSYATTVAVNFANFWNGLTAIDGAGVVAPSARILIKNQTDPTENGVYLFNGSRAADFAAAGDFTQGVVVPVNSGATQANSFWQVTSTTTKWSPGGPVVIATWATATAFTLNSYVVPTAAHANGYYFQATAIAGTGTSSGTEPTWPTTVGATVIDNAGANQITWTCQGLTPTPLNFVSKSFGGADASSLQAHGTIFQSLAVQFDNIVDARWQ